MNQKKIAMLCSIVIGVSAGTGIVNHFCTGCYKITVEGKTIGYVEDSSKYEKVLADVNAEIVEDYGQDSALQLDAKLDNAFVSKDMISSEEELHNNISELSIYMDDSYVVSVNGTEICNLRTDADAYAVLNSIIKTYSADGTGEFIEDIKVEKKKAGISNILSTEDAYAALITQVSVKNTVEVSYYSTKDYEVKEITDNTLSKGNRSIVQEGEVGEYDVSAVIEYINGVEQNRTIISEELIKEPVTEIVRVGTKEIPGVGTGSFIMPAKGRLSSPFGSRWGRLHRGIDIAASTGTPIYASDRGVVVCAEYKNSYGNLVKIDHKNGFVTYYAHCSELLVNEGEIVTQGQMIAKVGNTGNSTGPHCHFEIQKNSEPQDPFNYIQ